MFLQHNQKAGGTVASFTEWLYHCFKHRRKQFLQHRGLEFNFLLILSNVSGLSESLAMKMKKVPILSPIYNHRASVP